MKRRVVSLLLVMSMVLMLVACGGSSIQESTETPEPTKTPTQLAFDLSKEAYENINTAYSMLNTISSDIYEAWRVGIDSASDLKKLANNSTPNDGIDLIAKELNLSSNEFYEGLKRYHFLTAGIDISDEESINSLTEETKKKVDELIAKFDENHDRILYLAIQDDSLFSHCVWGVVHAYKQNGMFDTVSTLISDAKQQMKQLSNEHSDYEHYPSLKGYFTQTNALNDFCNSPEGSFDQLVNTINEYRNEARKYQNDLNYIFED